VHRRGRLHAGHVGGDPLGDARGQRLDVELARDVLHHAALLDARCVLDALELDRDGGVDLLVEADLEQVDVDDLVADRVVLLVLDDHRHRLAVADLDVDHGGAGDQRGTQLARVDPHGGAVAAAVDDAWDLALAAEAARGP
jgi:hypothetical protein